MKFLNHLDLVENEARRLKMYRVAAGSYTPGVTTSGNIIMDTAAAIPKWWDGSAWRDFSYNTTGGVNTQNAYATSAISSSGIKLRLSGSGAAGNTTDDVEFLGAGGATVSLGNASQIVITTTDTNTTYGALTNTALGLAKTRFAALNNVTPVALSEASGRTYGVQKNSSDQLVVQVPWENTTTNTQNAYAVSAADGSNTSQEKIVLTGSGAAGSTTDFVEIGAGTGLTISRAGDVITLANSVTNTNTTYTATVATGITLSGTTFTVNTWSQISLAAGGSTQGETAGRWYRVNTDTAGKLIVNVPWSDTNTNTQRAAGVGMSLATNTLNVNTWGAQSVTATNTSEAGTQWYKVHTDASDRLIVRVPWVNTQTADTNTQATYTIPVSAGAGNTAVVTLTGGGAASTTETLTFAGTTSEIAVTESTGNNGTITIGLPDDVTIGNDLIVTGDLTVSGATTTLNTQELLIEDIKFTCNSGAAANAVNPNGTYGMEVERGNQTNSGLFWIEATDKWVADFGGTQTNIIQNLFSTVTGNSGTATANASTTALAVTGTGGIVTTAANQGLVVSAPGMSTGTAVTLVASSIGSATNKRANVTHALGTKDVIVRCYLIAGEGAYEEIYANVTVMSTTVVKLEFSAQPTSNVRVVVTAAKTTLAGTSVAYA